MSTDRVCGRASDSDGFSSGRSGQNKRGGIEIISSLSTLLGECEGKRCVITNCILFTIAVTQQQSTSASR